MGEHRTMERHCDVVIVGTTLAGLAAAEAVAGAGRVAIVVESGPTAPLPADRVEAVRRLGVEVLQARVAGGEDLGDGRDRVELTGGHAVVGRQRIELALDARERDGARAGEAAVAALVDAEAHEDSAPANVVDWDHRYSGDPVWSGNPNGTMVALVGPLAPGRALDVGAGEGGDAVWLAEQGWSVTASDLSPRALDRIGGEAERRGLEIELLCVDANAPGAYPEGAYDLVSAQYASIPRTPDGRALENLLGAVAPGGTLLVVAHDLTPMRSAIDTAAHSRVFDPDAYVRVTDVAAAVRDDPGWELLVHEHRPRPAGAASTHHVDDEVLLARRP